MCIGQKPGTGALLTPRSQRAVGSAALLGAVVALVIHLTAVIGAPLAGMGAIFIIFPAGILSWGILIRHVNRRGRSGGPQGPLALILPLPVWARLVFGAVFLYALLNFLLFFQATGGGSVERDANGQAVLSGHGRVIRTLDENGVRAIEVWQVRAFSGHILPFLVLPGLYFLLAPADDDAKRERGRAA